MKLVRDALWNMDDLTCLNLPGLAVNGETRISLKQENELLDIVDVILLGGPLSIDEHQHHVLPDNELPLPARHVLRLNIVQIEEMLQEIPLKE